MRVYMCEYTFLSRTYLRIHTNIQTLHAYTIHVQTQSFAYILPLPTNNILNTYINIMLINNKYIHITSLTPML